MHLIQTQSQYRRALEILVGAFEDIPGTNIFTRTEEKQLSIHELCSFCLEESIERHGAFLSNDENGVALVFRNFPPKRSLRRLFRKLRFIHRGIGWKNLRTVLARERKIKKIRPQEDSLFFWMLAADVGKAHPSPAADLKEKIFEYADKLGLPIYAETTVRKNRIVYERYGFHTYDELRDRSDEFSTWFLVRHPQNAQS